MTALVLAGFVVESRGWRVESQVPADAAPGPGDYVVPWKVWPTLRDAVAQAATLNADWSHCVVEIVIARRVSGSDPTPGRTSVE